MRERIIQFLQHVSDANRASAERNARTHGDAEAIVGLTQLATAQTVLLALIAESLDPHGRTALLQQLEALQKAAA